jgi:hypothetical protein
VDVPPDGTQGAEAGGAETAPLQVFVGRPRLGQIVAYLKHQSTKGINGLRDTPYAPVWQRNYYEHIIRSQAEWDRARKYIVRNPARWEFDTENPAAAKNVR